MEVLGFIYRQLFVKLPYPTASWEGKTVVITGSNVGLGREAARHFARLGASKVVLAVRSLEKGNAAKADIEQTTGRSKDVIEVWQLDLSSYESVQSFAERVNRDLDRIDAFIANASIATYKHILVQGNESTITVNVVSTFLLLLMVLPKLEQVARKHNIRPTVTITSSEVHGWAKFEERSAPDGQIFKTLNDKETANMKERYPLSKLLQVFGVRRMTEKRPASSTVVTFNYLNPGLCHSELGREGSIPLEIMKFFLARSTECGSRTIVHAASQGVDTHGKYLSDCKITPPSPLVRSEEGKVTQDRVWDELAKQLEAIRPGVTSNL